MPSRIAPRFLLLVAVTLTPAILQADTVYLKSGGKVEGRVEVRGRHYLVKTDRGIEVRIPLGDVRSVEISNSNRDTYKKKRAALVEGDVPGLVALAKWCETEGLKAEAVGAYKEILVSRPDHPGARKALGFVKFGDEWLTREEAKPREGLIRHRGRWVTPERKAELEAKEKAEKERKRIRKLVRKVGSTIPDVKEEAEAKLLAYSDEEKFPVLLNALGYSDKPVRRYATRELGRIGNEEAVRPLAKVAVEDRLRTVRISAVRALKAIGAENTAVPLMEKLNSRNPYHRLHAVEALSVFPDKRSVRRLIETWHGISGGFGRGYIMDATMQTYIRDYQLASGGTGFVAVEVADPELGTLTTGVIFETKVQYAEIIARTQTLTYLTGAEAGYSRKSWAKWWNANKDTFELASHEPVQAD